MKNGQEKESFIPKSKGNHLHTKNIKWFLRKLSINNLSFKSLISQTFIMYYRCIKKDVTVDTYPPFLSFAAEGSWGRGTLQQPAGAGGAPPPSSGSGVNGPQAPGDPQRQYPARSSADAPSPLHPPPQYRGMMPSFVSAHFHTFWWGWELNRRSGTGIKQHGSGVGEARQPS